MVFCGGDPFRGDRESEEQDAHVCVPMCAWVLLSPCLVACVRTCVSARECSCVRTCTSAPRVCDCMRVTVPVCVCVLVFAHVWSCRRCPWSRVGRVGCTHVGTSAGTERGDRYVWSRPGVSGPRPRPRWPKARAWEGHRVPSPARRSTDGDGGRPSARAGPLPPATGEGSPIDPPPTEGSGDACVQGPLPVVPSPVPERHRRPGPGSARGVGGAGEDGQSSVCGPCFRSALACQGVPQGGRLCLIGREGAGGVGVEARSRLRVRLGGL